MRLRNFTRLNKSDYPKELQDVVEQLAQVLNDNFTQLYEVLNGKSSLADNQLSVIRDVPITVDANGIPTTTSTFSLQGSQMTVVQGCHVIKVTNNVNPSVYPAGGVTINFSQSGQLVTLTHVTGIQPGVPWTLKIVAYG